MQSRATFSKEQRTNISSAKSPATSAAVRERRAAVRTLNDALRRTGQGGRVMMTAGVAALSAPERAEIMHAVATFDDFDADNDPYGEHDFAIIERPGDLVCFKLDAYDRTLMMASPDPTDPAVTIRVLTVMLVEEM